VNQGSIFESSFRPEMAFVSNVRRVRGKGTELFSPRRPGLFKTAGEISATGEIDREASAFGFGLSGFSGSSEKRLGEESRIKSQKHSCGGNGRKDRNLKLGVSLMLELAPEPSS
jgi:hypothetical protein